MIRRRLGALWAAVSLIPIGSYVTAGFSGKTVVAAALACTGWAFLVRGVRRDPGGEVLAAFRRTLPARILVVSMAALVFAVGLTLSFSHALVGLVAFGALVLALWSGAQDGEAMARSAGNWLLLAWTLVVIVGACEVVFRLPPVVARTGGDTPGMARWEREHYDRVWETNRLRARSFHVDEPRGKGLRILTLGDSFTWGDKIARTEDVWPYVLERRIVASGRRAHVINLAVGGFTTVNEAEVMRTSGWSFAPDVLILQFYLNDPLPSGPGLKREGDRWYLRTLPLLPLGDQTLDSRSYFYSFLSGRFRALQVTLRYPDGYAGLYDEGFPGWQACKDALAELARESRRRDVPMLFVLFPVFASESLADARYPYTEVDRKVLRTLDDLGVPALDLRPVYARREEAGRYWWALPCNNHPSVEAHEIAAEAIEKRLAELEMLTPRPAAPRPRSSS
jgi:lysophospholipase L1-like esterase